MKRWLLCAMVAMLAGCEYQAPLIDQPAGAVDARILNTWRAVAEDGSTVDLLVLQLDDASCLVRYQPDSNSSLYFKGKPATLHGKTVVQLQWIGTGDSSLAADKRTYQLAMYQVRDEFLEMRLLNSAIVSSQLKTTRELTKAIDDNRDKPDLFKEPVVFRKIRR